MPFYDIRPYETTLKWSDIFTSNTDFISQVTSIGGITDTDDLTELYEILANKYLFSYTRYRTPEPFIFALKRELYTEFPYYLEKKTLANSMINELVADIQLQQIQLRNIVDTHDEPIVNADTVAFDDLSTTQENLRVSNNKLDALKQKYNVMNRDFLRGVYARCDELFRVILSEDEIPLYEEE